MEEKITDFQLTIEEQIKSKILFQTLSGSVEYCFDLNYRNDLTLEERQQGFLENVKEYISASVPELISYYGLDFFRFTDKELAYLSSIGVRV